MTDAHRKAITQALAYIIKELVPVPKTSAARQKREELLQDLINAGRPSKVSAAEYGQPQPAAPGAAPSQQPPPQGEGVALSVRLEMPDGPAPTVRPGTVFGAPVDVRTRDVEDEPK